MWHAGRTTFTLLNFYPKKHVAFIFAIISEYAHSHIQSVCEYGVSCTNNHIRSHYMYMMIKKKKHAKIKSLTVRLLLFSLIILVTFHTIFAAFYFALFQYFHDI